MASLADRSPGVSRGVPFRKQPWHGVHCQAWHTTRGCLANEPDVALRQASSLQLLNMSCEQLLWAWWWA